jgi:flagellar FliL protein
MAKDKEELDESDASEDAGTKGKKGIIIVAAVVLLLLIGGAAAYFLVFAKDEPKKAKADTEVEESIEEGGEEHGEGGEKGGKVEKYTGPIYFEMPEFLVNLNTAGKQVSFLKMKVTLELKKKADLKIVEGFMPRITDSFNTYLRELRPTDLAGSAGMYRLREELLLRINQAIAPAKVENILFKEVIIQ